MEILKESDADIIVLQEVAPWFAQRLLRQEWVKGYQLPQKNGRPVLAYEYLLLSKYPIESFTLVDLPGRQKRKFFMAVVKVDERKVSIGTCHLESMLEDGPTRAKQLDIAFAELAKTDDAIFLGDFNFGDGEQPDTAHLNVAYVDAWMTLHPKRSGYTWDIETSPMARAGSFPNEPSRRIDRVLVRSELWKPKSIAIIGNTPVSKETPHIFPSDHFGLLATLELKD
jgi:tyrosyl-DNA phosphodiesterase 2